LSSGKSPRIPVIVDDQTEWSDFDGRVGSGRTTADHVRTRMPAANFPGMIRKSTEGLHG